MERLTNKQRKIYKSRGHMTCVVGTGLLWVGAQVGGGRAGGLLVGCVAKCKCRSLKLNEQHFCKIHEVYLQRLRGILFIFFSKFLF